MKTLTRELLSKQPTQEEIDRAVKYDAWLDQVDYQVFQQFDGLKLEELIDENEVARMYLEGFSPGDVAHHLERLYPWQK